MKKGVNCIFVFILICFVNILNGQSQININIKNYPDSALILTTYYGDRIILVDTAFTASTPGVFTFDNKETLQEGIYIAVSPARQKLFEFVMDTGTTFTLTTDTLNYVLQMKVDGSEENKVFFEYTHFSDKLYRENLRIAERMKAHTEGSDAYRKLQNQQDSLNRLAAEYKLEVIREKPQLFVARLFNAMRDVEIPAAMQKSADNKAAYRYYREHYWDHFDLQDASLLHTPLYARKVDQYFSQVIPHHPDSVAVAIDEVIEQARPNKETVSWLLWHFMSIYQEPEYMGFDKVFIYLVDNYFMKEEIDNLTPSIRQKLIERANIMRPLLLGNEAPNLILIDSTGSYQSFQSLEEEFIVLFFWDIECGICKQEIKELKALYSRQKFDLEVFAISVNADLEMWKENLIESNFPWINVNGTRSVTSDFHDLYDIHGTPAIYLLDKDRKIIAKQLSADQIEGFLDNYQ